MAAIAFAKPRLMQWDGNNITDHNRSELSITVERIEKKSRMANGLLRKYWIADKRSFACSWTMLPHTSNFTVDGFYGANQMENFYNTHPGDFELRISYGDGSFGVHRVMFTEFSKTLAKRGKFDMYEVSVSMEEV